jgi:hypothetical protein
MELLGELLNTVRRLSALETRAEDVAKANERIYAKMLELLDRLSRLEQKHDALRESVKNEILADIKASVAETRLMLEYETKRAQTANLPMIVAVDPKKTE